ncbi:hypothetical protein FQA47_022273 [Oryzias melastigma]|uniref:Uncharacterized protein n=1 Tax=Oryzias melastigma TaxID=30732 RepID=A0A834FJ64_ORYME|nr:hypothetical protein FQA47_022273 [Oryzias melastigma]
MQTTTLQVMTSVPNLETRSLMEITVKAKRAIDIMEMGNPIMMVIVRVTDAKMNIIGRRERTGRRKIAVSGVTMAAVTATTVLSANVTATATTVLAANVTAARTVTTALAVDVATAGSATTVLAVDVATAGSATTVLAVDVATAGSATMKENMATSMTMAMVMVMVVGVVMDEEDTGNRQKMGQ